MSFFIVKLLGSVSDPAAVCHTYDFLLFMLVVAVAGVAVVVAVAAVVAVVVVVAVQLCQGSCRLFVPWSQSIVDTPPGLPFMLACLAVAVLSP